MLKKANRTSLVDQVADQIESLVETGHWKVGDRLPSEMDLMKEFGVSRNTLREAIRALVHAGMLETKQGSGTIVKSTSSLEAAVHRQIKKTSLMATLEVRLALEREAAQLAALRRTTEDILQMEKTINLCQKAAKQKDLEAFLQADIEFHEAVVEASHNGLLQKLYEYMTESLYSSIRKVMVSDAYFDYEKEIHRDFFQSIKHQDEHQAVAYVNDYINEFKKKIEYVQED